MNLKFSIIAYKVNVLIRNLLLHKSRNNSRKKWKNLTFWHQSRRAWIQPPPRQCCASEIINFFFSDPESNSLSINFGFRLFMKNCRSQKSLLFSFNLYIFTTLYLQVGNRIWPGSGFEFGNNYGSGSGPLWGLKLDPKRHKQGIRI